ncbi:MAG: ammonium transporter [Alphaproteobacteria bacterium]|nr:ammonium transporter [Alphaproteobacteria bacterium]
MNDETVFILNTLFFLFSGALVMFMAAGFTLLESGMVRSKSVAVILTKNIALYAVAGVMFYLIGYHLMYRGVAAHDGLFGTFGLWRPDDAAAASGDFSAGFATTADWFFQMVFVATAASIVSGTLAERIKIWPFLLFTALLTGVLYPVTGSWVWGGGWLDALGFTDFAGSTMVHAVGGWAALSGAIVLGARRGRFDAVGKAVPIPGNSLPQVALGTFILWLGWFGFNGGSQLSLGSGADAIAVARIFANTNMAAAGGVLFVLIASQLFYKRIDLPQILNGALAGLVSITADPLTPEIGQALLIGGAGGLLMMAGVKALERLKIDDVVGAIPVHLVCGIWGTLAVPLTDSDAHFATQLLGVLAIGGFTSLCSAGIWLALKATVGIRLHWAEEDRGGDLSEIGLRAYHFDFGTG